MFPVRICQQFSDNLVRYVTCEVRRCRQLMTLRSEKRERLGHPFLQPSRICFGSLAEASEEPFFLGKFQFRCGLLENFNRSFSESPEIFISEESAELLPRLIP